MMLASIVNKNSSRRRRRSVVVLMYLGVAGIPGTFAWWAAFVPADPAPSGWLAFVFVLLLISSVLVSSFIVATFAALRASTQEVANEDDERLDERQRMVRDDAHRTAYHVFTRAVMVLFLLYFVLDLALDGVPSWMVETYTIVPIYFTFLYLMMTLPTAVLAWNEPAPEWEDK